MRCCSLVRVSDCAAKANTSRPKTYKMEDMAALLSVATQFEVGVGGFASRIERNQSFRRIICRFRCSRGITQNSRLYRLAFVVSNRVK